MQASRLGLPTVDAIIMRSGGCVEVASRPGLGTIFDVVLPDADRAESIAA